MAELTGNVTGRNRQQLIDQAKDEAIQYYGNECFTIAITCERSETEYEQYGIFDTITPTRTSFTANYTATPSHRWVGIDNLKQYCFTCGTER